MHGCANSEEAVMGVEDSKSCCVRTGTVRVNSRYYGGGRRFLTSSYAVDDQECVDG